MVGIDTQEIDLLLHRPLNLERQLSPGSEKGASPSDVPPCVSMGKTALPLMSFILFVHCFSIQGSLAT